MHVVFLSYLRCILFGTSMRWNFSGMKAARWGMWKSPTTSTSSPKSAPDDMHTEYSYDDINDRYL